jgi:hypothetical protein
MEESLTGFGAAPFTLLRSSTWQDCFVVDQAGGHHALKKKLIGLTARGNPAAALRHRPAQLARIATR